MARKRTSTHTNEEKGVTAMATGITEIGFDEIQALLAGAKQRGEYDRQIRLFVDSGAPGWKVPLDDGPFQGKKANSVKTGFTSAVNREGAPEGAKNVRIVVQGEAVYLIRMDT